MMLHFSDPAKLKARKIVFEEIYITPDPGTLEQLKELSSRRRLIEEARFQEFIYSCRSLHELRSQRHFAESLKVGGQIGLAIGVVRYALHKVKKKIPGDGKWRLVFKKEMEIVGELLRKLEHENNFVCYEKIPSPDELPIFEGKKLVSSLPYQPQRWEKKLVFKTED